MIGRSELFYHRTFGKGYVVFVSRDNLVRIFLCSFLDHLEQRRLHFLSVDDERTTENFVAAVFRVNLCETEYFRVSQFAAQILFHLHQVVHFFA